MEHIINLPGYREYFAPLVEIVKQHPKEMIPPKNFVEMTREEQQKWQWGFINKMMDVNPEIYYTIQSGLTMPQYLPAGVDPTALHYGMF